MRKALLPMIASLALCGAATGALIATNAHAEQSGRKPVMLGLVGQDALQGGDTAAPAQEGGPTPEMMRDHAAHRAQFCKDMYARKVGEMAFLEAKLSLSGGQQPLFDHWKQVNLDVAKQHESDCTTGHEHHQPGERPSVVDRLNHEEMMLRKRLADLDAEKPTLTAFYDALSPQQKEEFGHAAMHRMGERMHMMGMMGHRPGMGGPMGGPPGPMGPHPMGPGPMGDAPPPPPAQ